MFQDIWLVLTDQSALFQSWVVYYGLQKFIRDIDSGTVKNLSFLKNQNRTYAQDWLIDR